MTCFFILKLLFKIIKAWDLTIIFNRAVINAIIVIAILESIVNVAHPSTSDPNDPIAIQVTNPLSNYTLAMEIYHG